MKNLLLISLLAICLMGAKTEDEKTVFSNMNIVWYGLDFTNANFVGDFNQADNGGVSSGNDLVKKYIPSWNNLFLNEAKKYDLLKTFDKQNIYYDIKTVNSLNAKINTENCISFNPKTLLPADIAKMVKKYTGDKKEGLGVSFIIENFNKMAVRADIYVVFFDITSKKVLLSEKVSGKPSGGGMRNYWAGAIRNILKEIDETEYKFWEQKYK